MTHSVGIADMAISEKKSDQIVTYALGSCLGVVVYDPVACVGGMVHTQLPLSRINPEKATRDPCMFVDTGVPVLFKACYGLGAQKNRLVVKVAGGAQTLDVEDQFRIGERNYAILRKILWKNNILIKGEDVGGTLSRTLSLDLGTGQVTVRSNGHMREL